MKKEPDFDFSEFVINNEPVPIEIASKIMKWHFWPLQQVRTALGIPVIISKHSCYRSVKYEIGKGRNGTSEHTFLGKGAGDITCSEMDRLLVAICSLTSYTRIAYYPENNFLHCDYRNRTRAFYINTYNIEKKKWEWIRQSGINDLLKVIRQKERI